MILILQQQTCYSNVVFVYREKICSNCFICVIGNKELALFCLEPHCQNTRHRILLNDTATDVQRAWEKMEFNFTSHFTLLMRASRTPGSALTWGELPLAWPDLPPGPPPSQGSQECLQQEKAAAVKWGVLCSPLTRDKGSPASQIWNSLFLIRGKHKRVI